MIYSGELRGGATVVRQHFIITPSGIEVTDTVAGDLAARRQYFPMMVTDGLRKTDIELTERSATVSYTGSRSQTYRMYGNRSLLARLGVAEPFRNGVLDAAYAEGRDPTMRYTIQPRRT